MAYEIIHSDELYHFGILGQKWGIRRYQNPDGSYTAAGKARYAQYKEDIEKRTKSESGKIRTLNERSSTIIDKANELGEEYAKAYKNVKISDKQKEKIWKQLKEDFGSADQIDDEEYFEIDVEYLLDDAIKDSLPNDLKQKRKEFDEYQEKYWNDVHDFTDKIVNEYSNVKVKGITNVSDETRKIIYDALDTAMPAYISRHFDDYWVNDTDESYDAVERLKQEFTLDEFRKHS